jgi:predicted ABC-type ATPase
MQPADTYVLPFEENNAIFNQIIASGYLKTDAKVNNPELHIMGAQPGSGKSFAIDKIMAQLKTRDGDTSVVEISGDDYRSFHPLYEHLLMQDDALAAYFTDIDSGRWVEQAIAFTAAQHSHVVLEGTLRNPQVNLDTANRYLMTGYTAHLHIMAVHEFISRIRIFLRYLAQVEHRGYGRYTLPEAHDRSYNVLPDSVENLVESGRFSTVTIYDADNQILLSLDCSFAETAATVRSVLDSVRAGIDVDSAELLPLVEDLMRRAKKHGRDVVIADLSALIKEIETWTG